MLNALMGKFKPRKAKSDRLNENGHEIVDSRPMVIPAGMKRPETLHEQVARLVRTEQWNQMLEEKGFETFDEANDFDDDFDDPEPFSAHEMIYDPVLERHVAPSDFEKNKDKYLDAYRQAYKDAPVPDFIAEEPKKRGATPPKAKKPQPPAEPSGDEE